MKFPIPKRFKNRLGKIFFLSPLFLFLTFFFLILLLGIGVSFLGNEKSIIDFFQKAPFVGFANYEEILLSKDSSFLGGFLNALRNSVIYTICVSTGCVVLGLFGAVLMQQNFKGVGFLRFLLLLSWVVPTYVVGILWGFMWQQNEGVINVLLFDVLHFDVITSFIGAGWEYHAGKLIKPRWLTGQNTIWAIIVPTIWRSWPFYMMMFWVGLSSISRETYENAEIDGAGKISAFFNITLPQLRPIFALVILQSVVLNMYSFNLVAMMFGNGSGFPGKFGDLLMTFIYRATFQTWNFGLGAALSTLFMGVMLFAVFFWYRLFREDI
ncbi:MAG: sugar ABC transporter permease [Fibrobacter sp.]|jgi:multiple sugar transport system permease protein|nr:sugar ABC transporter permease [Fibrobacter sp.]